MTTTTSTRRTAAADGSPSSPSLRARLRLDGLPEQLEPPTVPQIASAGVVAAGLSVAAAWVLALLGRAVFTVPAAFDKFNVGGFATLTVGGVVGATVAWAVVARVSSAPAWLLARLAVVVSAVLLVPDFLLLPQADNPAGPVVVLMLMHVAIGVVTYLALVRLAPVRARADLDA